MSSSLCFPTFVPPQSTLIPPFPCLCFLPKHTMSFVQSLNALAPLMSPYPPAVTPQSVGDLRTAYPRDSQWWMSLQTHGADVLLGCPGGSGQGLVSLTGLLRFPCLALCCSASLCLERLEEGKCHSCLQEEQEGKSGKL